MRIGILNTDTIKIEFATKYGQYPAMFSKVLLRADPNLQLSNYEVQTGEYPASIDECDAYLITGSKVSAYDGLPWINELKIFIQSLHSHQKKLIGICFGHQLIAQALGGSVKRAKSGWHVGIHAAKLKQHANFFSNTDQAFNLIYNHQDQVVKMPDNFILLASCTACPIAMYSIADHILSFQGHIEFDVKYAKDLLSMRRDILGEEKYLKAWESIKTRPEDTKAIDWILKFLTKN